MIKAAYLRVYLPAERFGAWRQHASQRNVVWANDHFVWQEETSEDAYTVEWDGRSYVCPRNARLRMLEGVIAFSNSYPGSSLISEQALNRAADRLERLRVSAPGTRSYILTSPWHVPLRWFAAFTPEERDLYEGEHGLSVRYRTLVGDAVDRVRSGVEAVSGAGFNDAVVEQVEELFQWLSGFSYDGLVELDYSEVAGLFSDGDLALDDSAEQVQKSLRALETGKLMDAGEAYASVASRWSQAQSLSYVN
jgi:hypothetical protein